LIPSAKRRAVFLDRDGTINEEKDYLHRVEDFEFIPGTAEAIRRLKEAGFLVIVVTNQSGVARGYYTLDDVAFLHDHMQRELETFGASVDGIYVCPHHPVEGVGEYRRECDCRKGRPGMLLRGSMKTRSPSCDWACSEIPIVARSPSRRTHSWSSV
jgi:D-glycero-D-manno-heptose 1,7-bisphosphate phosphatase